jgi:hypothetical protein
MQIKPNHIPLAWLTAALENMGGHHGDVFDFAGAPAVRLDESRQLAMFAVEVAKQAAFAAVDPLDSGFEAEARVDDALDVVVNLFDAVRDTGTGPGVVMYFPRWYFAD